MSADKIDVVIACLYGACYFRTEISGVFHENVQFYAEAILNGYVSAVYRVVDDVSRFLGLYYCPVEPGVGENCESVAAELLFRKIVRD